MIVCQRDGEERKAPCLYDSPAGLIQCHCPEVCDTRAEALAALARSDADESVGPKPVPAMTDADLRAEILYAQTRLGNVLRVLEERDRR